MKGVDCEAIIRTTHHRVLEEYVGLLGVDVIKLVRPQLQELRGGLGQGSISLATIPAP